MRLNPLEDLLNAFRKAAKAENAGDQSGARRRQRLRRSFQRPRFRRQREIRVQRRPGLRRRRQCAPGFCPGPAGRKPGTGGFNPAGGPAFSGFRQRRTPAPVPPIPFFAAGGEPKGQESQSPASSSGPSADADYSDHFGVFEDTLDETKLVPQAGRQGIGCPD